MEQNIRWTDRIYSEEQEWFGNIFDFYSRVNLKLILDLRKPFKLVDQIRIDETQQQEISGDFRKTTRETARA